MFISRFNIGRITGSDQLKKSLKHNPYRHIQVGSTAKKIKKGSLSDLVINNDFSIMINIPGGIGHVMTFERVTVENGVCTIMHLAVHDGFRGYGFGKPCVEALLHLLKKEKSISKVLFLETHGQNPLYQKFFNVTLQASLLPGKVDEWELTL